MMLLIKEVDKQVENLNRELESFVEESTLKDILIQWTQTKRNRLCILAECLIMKAKVAVNNTKEELRIQKLRVSEKTKHEKEINDLAKDLALQMKGKYLHRPDGIGGYRWTKSNKMAVDFCNYSITTDYSYSSEGKTGKYKNYKEHYPDWDIPPNSDVSKYWMWVMCTYKEQLKEMYSTDDPDIPRTGG
ncbi:unnamed protein product [Mytilus edulis]|uniref:Uncharacterized protein n=1 Tax=Mytilus edulis TaxID=6550 RepID=A0A8S3QB75_MYTED|nr:unnamed protein product [Mytilus edulis]